MRKLCLRIGASCPNRDGSLGEGGCIYCAEPEPPPPGHEPLAVQIERGLAHHRPDVGLIAYVQDHSATYVEPSVLDRALTTIQQIPGLIGIHLGTRPDCLEAPILAILARHARRTGLLLELGLQTADDATLSFVQRAHDVACFTAAVERLHAAGLRVCAHVILGLPAPPPTRVEGRDQAVATAELLARLGVEAVKVHNCHVLRGTPLEALHSEGLYRPPELEGYIERLVPFLEHLPAEVEVHRMVGEARPPALIAPSFTADKARSLERIRGAFVERETWQGRLVPAGG